jgi:hypothetical protein
MNAITYLNSQAAITEEWPDNEEALELRGQLLAELSQALGALQRAGDALDRLRSPGVYDVEVADHIDGGIRGLRAAYAVAHMVFGKESP